MISLHIMNRFLSRVLLPSTIFWYINFNRESITFHLSVWLIYLQINWTDFLSLFLIPGPLNVRIPKFLKDPVNNKNKIPESDSIQVVVVFYLYRWLEIIRYAKGIIKISLDFIAIRLGQNVSSQRKVWHKATRSWVVV